VGLDLKTRMKITGEVSKRYARASKKEKGRMLDEFCALTNYNRKYTREGSCLRRPGREGQGPLPEGPGRTGARAESPSTPPTCESLW